MNFSRKSLVALFSVAFALVVAGPVSAACSISTLSECDTAGLQTLIAQLLSGQTTTQTQTTTATGNAPAACAGVSFTRNLTVGSSGADVKCLQALLNQAADTQVAATGVGSAGNETTYFGVKTQTAVKAFQTKYGITPVYGYVGSITRAKLNELLTAGTGTGTGTSNLPAGCTSTAGYSPTTGESCSGTQTSNLPAGCTSTAGYSPTTGQSCSGTGTGTVSGTPLTVALASDTPAGGNIMAGEANKVVTKLTFTAAADADATINTLKIKSYGTAADADVTNIKIFDNNVQVGNTYSQLSAGTAFFTFVPGITVTKGTSKTIDVVATVRTAPNYSATVRLGVEAATSIGGTSFTGTYPVVGNAFTIIYGGNIGTVTVAKTGTVPSTSVGAGTANVVLGNVRISANSTEDITVSQIVVTASSTAAAIYDGDVTNIRANINGVTQGTVTGFVNRKATINFATPITITKGGSVVVQILGDVTLGVGREIKMFVDTGSVSAKGVTSGVGIANTAASTADSTISITAGRLTLSTSTASPSGPSAQYVKSSTPQILGAFNVKATGEQVLVTKIYAGVKNTVSTTTTGTITSVGVYNSNGSLISQTYDLAAADWNYSTYAVKTFDVSITIDANATETFYVKGITSGISAPTTATVAVTLPATQTENNGYSIVGTGLTSSGQQGQSSDNVKSSTVLTLPTITIYGGATAAVAANTTDTPQDQYIPTSHAQVLAGTVKITAQREDQTLSQLVLTGVPSSSTTAEIFSGVALFDGDTQVTDFVVPSTNTVTFSTNDILSPGVTFTKGVAKTLKIVGNTLAGSDGTIYFKVLASGITTIGNDSGETATAPTSDTNLTFSDGSYNHGTYTMGDVIVTVAKNAASPSGTVGRGTFQTYAIWDLVSYGTNDDVTMGTTTFTSNSGIPSGLTSTTTDLAMFRLVDADTSALLASAATSLDTTYGTVTFVPTANNTISAGITKRVALLITTTDTTKWAANTGMWWTVGGATDIILSTGGLGSGDGVNFSVPADANAVSIGS